MRLEIQHWLVRTRREQMQLFWPDPWRWLKQVALLVPILHNSSKPQMRATATDPKQSWYILQFRTAPNVCQQILPRKPPEKPTQT